MEFFPSKLLKCLIGINWVQKIGSDRAAGGWVGVEGASGPVFIQHIFLPA